MDRDAEQDREHGCEQHEADDDRNGVLTGAGPERAHDRIDRHEEIQHHDEYERKDGEERNHDAPDRKTDPVDPPDRVFRVSMSFVPRDMRPSLSISSRFSVPPNRPMGLRKIPVAETTMQTEERSICPSCGGDNPKAAAFCWRCYASFASMPSIPGQNVAGTSARPAGRLGVPSMPSPPTAPTPMTSSGGSSMTVRIIVGALVAIVVAFGARSVLGGGASLPDTLAGTPRMTTQDVKDFEREMSGYGKRSDLDVVAGAYGTGAIPTSSCC